MFAPTCKTCRINRRGVSIDRPPLKTSIYWFAYAQFLLNPLISRYAPAFPERLCSSKISVEWGSLFFVLFRQIFAESRSICHLLQREKARDGFVYADGARRAVNERNHIFVNSKSSSKVTEV